MVQGKWETDIFGRYDQIFTNYTGDRITSDIHPLQAAIQEKVHPWNIFKMGIGGGGLLGSFMLSSLWGPLFFPGIIGTGIAAFKAHTISEQKDAELNLAKTALDEAVWDMTDLHIDDVSATHIDILDYHTAAGFLSAYDTVHFLTSYAPASTPAASPQSVGTHLTRTEVETYTDSQGKRQTRERIVDVFTGLLVEFDVPDAETENRILITSRRTHNMSGIFERMKFSKRQRLQDIKTSSLEFNRIYKVSSDDPTLAHEFMDPDRIVRWLNLHEDLANILGMRKVPMSILITQGKAIIAVETGLLPKNFDFSLSDKKIREEIRVLTQYAMLPHVIAEHLKLPGPIPYAWQDHIAKTERSN